MLDTVALLETKYGASHLPLFQSSTLKTRAGSKCIKKKKEKEKEKEKEDEEEEEREKKRRKGN